MFYEIIIDHNIFILRLINWIIQQGESVLNIPTERPFK